MAEKKYLKDIAYEKIKDMIIRGNYEGTFISESELVSLLNMSRTPIREALQKLQNNNFLEISPQRGAYIKEVSITEANDLMDVRHAIEIFSIERISPTSFTQQHINALEEKILEQEYYVNDSDIYNFIKSDLEYHEIFLKVLGNEYFVKTLQNVMDRLFIHGMKRFQRDIMGMQDSINDHKKINNYLIKKDFVCLKKTMEEHISKGKITILY